MSSDKANMGKNSYGVEYLMNEALIYEIEGRQTTQVGCTQLGVAPSNIPTIISPKRYFLFQLHRTKNPPYFLELLTVHSRY